MTAFYDKNQVKKDAWRSIIRRTTKGLTKDVLQSVTL